MPPERDYDWDHVLCAMAHCINRADLLIDEVPYCFDCEERWRERMVAIEIHPEMARSLPPLWER